jgi:hypothetical protein
MTAKPKPKRLRPGELDDLVLAYMRRAWKRSRRYALK